MNESGIDITDEYTINADTERGKFIIEEGYRKTERKKEIAVARWIFQTFGGNITLLAETDSVYMGKRADYLWRGKLWELKNTGSAKAIDSALRKALQQIRENPGGVIIDIGKSRDAIKCIESVINERVRKSCRFSLDIMIIKNKTLLKVLRY